MIKRTIIVGCMLILSTAKIVFASPLDDVITNLSNMEADVQEINYEVSVVEEEIYNVKKDISNVEKEIEKNKLEIRKIEDSINSKEREISSKVRLTYMNNASPSQQYLEILLNSKNIKDFAQRLFTIKEIMSSDKEKLDFFNLSKKEIEFRQEDMLVRKTELDDMVNSLNSKLDLLVEKKSDKESKISEYQNTRARYESEIQEYEAMITDSAIDSMPDNREEYNSYSSEGEVNDSEPIQGTDSENSNANSSSIVNIAFKYLGVPYVWGGTSPSGFDCSGFVQYVYREAGINISRTTYTQIAEGYAVTDLQPGDLVFFGSYSAPYHVGIYIGNGQYVHAPMEGDVVKVASLQYRGDYCGARRYL